MLFLLVLECKNDWEKGTESEGGKDGEKSQAGGKRKDVTRHHPHDVLFLFPVHRLFVTKAESIFNY